MMTDTIDGCFGEKRKGKNVVFCTPLTVDNIAESMIYLLEEDGVSAKKASGLVSDVMHSFTEKDLLKNMLRVYMMMINPRISSNLLDKNLIQRMFKENVADPNNLSGPWSFRGDSYKALNNSLYGSGGQTIAASSSLPSMLRQQTGHFPPGDLSIGDGEGNGYTSTRLDQG